MINKNNYAKYYDRVLAVLIRFQTSLLQDQNVNFGSEDIFNLLSFTSDKKNVTYNKDEMKLSFIIGGYHFFMQGFVNASNGNISAYILTFEEIKYPLRIKSEADKLPKHIKSLDININSKLEIEGTAEVLKDYYLKLIKYIDDIEKSGEPYLLFAE